jgi:hypothetical protein
MAQLHAFRRTDRSTKSITDCLSLRLVSHQTKCKTDYEMAQYTINQVGETVRNLDRSLRYSFATNSIPRDPFRDCNPTLVVEPEPKTYKDIQNIGLLSTYRMFIRLAMRTSTNKTFSMLLARMSVS